MSKKTFVTLAAAAMMVPGVAKAEPKSTLKDTTNKGVLELFEGVKQDKVGDVKTISFADAEKLEISPEELMNLLKKITEEERRALVEKVITDMLEDRTHGIKVNKGLRNAEKELGKEYLVNSIDFITQKIIEDEKYWEVNHTGKLDLNQKQVEKLVETVFPLSNEIVDILAPTFLLIISIISFKLMFGKKKR